MLFFAGQDFRKQIAGHIVPNLFAMLDGVTQQRDGDMFDLEVALYNLLNRFTNKELTEVM